jgi:hypothetical protein
MVESKRTTKSAAVAAPSSDHHYGADGELVRTEAQRKLLADLEKNVDRHPVETESAEASFVAHEEKLHRKRLAERPEKIAKNLDKEKSKEKS